MIGFLTNGYYISFVLLGPCIDPRPSSDPLILIGSVSPKPFSLSLSLLSAAAGDDDHHHRTRTLPEIIPRKTPPLLPTRLLRTGVFDSYPSTSGLLWMDLHGTLANDKRSTTTYTVCCITCTAGFWTLDAGWNDAPIAPNQTSPHLIGTSVWSMIYDDQPGPPALISASMFNYNSVFDIRYPPSTRSSIFIFIFICIFIWICICIFIAEPQPDL
jgi:hypothetical protein